MKKAKISSPIFIVKRMNISKRNAWFIRIGGMLLAFLLSGILCTLISPGTFGEFYAAIFRGTFSTSSYIFNLLCCISTYLLLALAVTPAFKMKFWNIGVEGQTMVGCIVTAVILLLIPSSVPGPVVILMALIAGVGAGIIWALIPTLFKIKFNTNETLFTLLMNYVATALAAFTVAKCTRGGSGTFPMITDTSRLIISLGSVKYIPFIVCAIVFTVVMIFYLSKSKHGFELSVLGVSTNTARYVGISINKVTIRTMILSGGIAGLVGFLLVCGQHQTLTTTLVGGKGFTAVLIAWLGHFNPSEIAVYSSIIGFLDQGTTYAASKVKVTKNYFSGLILGLFILIVIISEFFVRYQVKRHESDKVIDARGKTLVLDDAKTSETSLLKEFMNVKASDYALKLSSAKEEYKTNRRNINKKIKLLNKQIIFGFKINQIDKDKMKKDLSMLKEERVKLIKCYKDGKAEYKIRVKCQRTIIRANTVRVARVIRKNVRFCVEQTKKNNVIFGSKEKIDVFLKKFIYTHWTFKSKPSVKQILLERKNWKSSLRKFKKSLRKNDSSTIAAQENDEALFKYLLVQHNRWIMRYLNNYRNRLRIQLRGLDMRNRRLAHKKEGK